MRVDPLYRATFVTPEAWSVAGPGPADGGSGQGFLIAEGRATGRLEARLRAANYPQRRADGVLLPDFRGVLETDDGATILFAWHGYSRTGAAGERELLGAITHVSDDERYRWLNDVFGVLTGQVMPRPGGTGFEVVLDVAHLVWESPA